jgi:exodeoxyribonuclease VII large subunit
MRHTTPPIRREAGPGVSPSVTYAEGVSRLPFDPAKMAQARAARPDEPLTVSQLALRIDAALKGGLPGPVRVRGEISNFRVRTHWYFALKDAAAVVDCVMFASATKRAGVAPADGMQVVVTGQVDFHAASGRVSLIVERVEPVGQGALAARLRAMVEELRRLGWLDPARKRPLPTFPRRVAVITSRGGAALQDVLATMRKRCPAVAVLVVDVRVQGEGAAEDIARAVRLVGSRHERLGVDVILLTRGGGSMEDLWAFNERVVAEAIVHSPIPVVAAIGHETDVTVAELVADERGATPTQAAMRLTPDTAALLRQIDATGRRLAGQVRRLVQAERRRVESLAVRPVLADARALLGRPRDRLGDAAADLKSAMSSATDRRRRRLDELALRLERQRPAAVQARLAERVRSVAGRLRRGMSVLLARHLSRVEALERHLRGVGPMAVLERGFSLTLGPDGRVVRRVADVSPGDVLQTRLIDGSIHSVVRPERPTRAASSPAEQPPGLFDPAPS